MPLSCVMGVVQSVLRVGLIPCRCRRIANVEEADIDGDRVIIVSNEIFPLKDLDSSRARNLSLKACADPLGIFRGS